MSLVETWDSLPQKWRDSVGRFVKVVVAAAVAAAGIAIFGGHSTPSELYAAVSIAVLSAVEKFFDAAPRAAKKVRKPKPAEG